MTVEGSVDSLLPAAEAKDPAHLRCCARTHGIQGVGQASHQLGLDELGLATLEGGLLLDGEGGGLHAELLQLVVAGL